jgi:hypothetical protein
MSTEPAACFAAKTFQAGGMELVVAGVAADAPEEERVPVAHLTGSPEKPA